MPDWGAGYLQAGRAVSDAFGMYAGAKMQQQENTAQDKRMKMAEAARQKREDQLRALEEMRRQNTTFQTFVNPQTGAVERITQGEVEGGTAKVPQHVLDAQRAAAEQQAIVDAEKRGLTLRKTEADIARSQASAQASRASAGLSQAKMENPERFRAQYQPQEQEPPAVAQARREFATLESPQEAHAAASAKYGSDIANMAFPGVAQSQQKAGDMVTGLARRFGMGGSGGTAQGADDINALLNKYTQSQ